MAQFVDRQREFQELDSVLQERGAHFIVVYGRRRVGKTTLILNWVRHTGNPYLYWVARRETADAARLSLAGSHIGMMVDLLRYQAPLYGRVTAQLPVEPLPYATLADFFPPLSNCRAGGYLRRAGGRAGLSGAL